MEGSWGLALWEAWRCQWQRHSLSGTGFPRIEVVMKSSWGLTSCGVIGGPVERPGDHWRHSLSCSGEPSTLETPGLWTTTQDKGSSDVELSWSCERGPSKKGEPRFEKWARIHLVMRPNDSCSLSGVELYPRQWSIVCNENLTEREDLGPNDSLWNQRLGRY